MDRAQVIRRSLVASRPSPLAWSWSTTVHPVGCCKSISIWGIWLYVFNLYYVPFMIYSSGERGGCWCRCRWCCPGPQPIASRRPSSPAEHSSNLYPDAVERGGRERPIHGGPNDSASHGGVKGGRSCNATWRRVHKEGAGAAWACRQNGTGADLHAGRWIARRTQGWRNRWEPDRFGRFPWNRSGPVHEPVRFPLINRAYIFFSTSEPAGFTGLPTGFFNRGNWSGSGFGNPGRTGSSYIASGLASFANETARGG
jgi:hypothetical protein